MCSLVLSNEVFVLIFFLPILVLSRKFGSNYLVCCNKSFSFTFSFFLLFLLSCLILLFAQFCWGFWKFSYQFLILFLKYIKEIRSLWYVWLGIISFYPYISSVSILHPPFNWWGNGGEVRLSNLPKITWWVVKVGFELGVCDSMLEFLMTSLWIASWGSRGRKKNLCLKFPFICLKLPYVLAFLFSFFLYFFGGEVSFLFKNIYFAPIMC